MHITEATLNQWIAQSTCLSDYIHLAKQHTDVLPTNITYLTDAFFFHDAATRPIDDWFLHQLAFMETLQQELGITEWDIEKDELFPSVWAGKYTAKEYILIMALIGCQTDEFYIDITDAQSAITDWLRLAVKMDMLDNVQIDLPKYFPWLAYDQDADVKADLNALNLLINILR